MQAERQETIFGNQSLRQGVNPFLYGQDHMNQQSGQQELPRPSVPSVGAVVCANSNTGSCASRHFNLITENAYIGSMTSDPGVIIVYLQMEISRKHLMERKMFKFKRPYVVRNDVEQMEKDD